MPRVDKPTSVSGNATLPFCRLLGLSDCLLESTPSGQNGTPAGGEASLQRY